MATQPHLRLQAEALVEITRRAAKGGLSSTGEGTWQNNTWAQYALLLALANVLLDQAPENAEACAELDVQAHTAQAIGQIVNTLHQILPGGIMEIISYLPEEKRKQGWGHGIKW